MKSSRAITLLEVVIAPAVLGILISLLFPAVPRQKRYPPELSERRKPRKNSAPFSRSCTEMDSSQVCA